jgi:hypothetical protein
MRALLPTPSQILQTRAQTGDRQEIMSTENSHYAVIVFPSLSHQPYLAKPAVLYGWTHGRRSVILSGGRAEPCDETSGYGRMSW